MLKKVGFFLFLMCGVLTLNDLITFRGQITLILAEQTGEKSCTPSIIRNFYSALNHEISFYDQHETVAC